MKEPDPITIIVSGVSNKELYEYLENGIAAARLLKTEYENKKFLQAQLARTEAEIERLTPLAAMNVQQAATTDDWLSERLK
ncbi:hypothetical protein [Serratia sp. M24T3]|uniref:hypothetical protein n=1 Tax=Serratia sp. M24T3 TaxID=932213 RepID=UPI00025BB651|nr:hypothetical protein [Serratia sp. M24T3]EIC83342.1 hypothetical protein SPM24T3_17065 [Serratia sp. M24T3]